MGDGPKLTLLERTKIQAEVVVPLIQGSREPGAIAGEQPAQRSSTPEEATRLDVEPELLADLADCCCSG